MMEKEDGKSASHRLVSAESWSSDLSGDSCEYYQTEIFGLLPSSQAYRRLHADGVSDPQVESLDRRSWSPSVPLRDLPVCLQDKRDLRELQHLQRRSIGYWDSWRRSQQKTRRRLKEQLGGALSGLLLWKHTLHKIEGQFGVGVKAYFVFLRYLLCLNLLYSIIITGTVLTPTLISRNYSSTHESPGFQTYSFKDFFVGSGVLETSPVFHSFYSYGSLDSKCPTSPILFLLGMISVLFLSYIMVVRRTVVGYKHSWLTGNRFSSNMSYKVFCGWDFSIQSPEAASLKHNFIRNEFKMDLEEQTFQQRVQQRTLKHWVQLILLRVFLNFLVLVLLGSSFILNFFARRLSHTECGNQWTVCLMLKYLPAITMTTVNYILLHVFSKISKLEDYSLTIQLNLTLIRSIFLNLASLGIYLIFLIVQVSSDKTKCEENVFGKEMYRLTILNFLMCFFNAFFVAYPRTLLVERFPSSHLAQILGKQQFEISFNVLDLVNSQTVTWVGVFYCPLLPAISAIRFLFLFYFKKFTVVRCCVPAQRMFRTASSSVLFHFMLLLGLFMAMITLIANIFRFEQGNCGPFENTTVFIVTSGCIEEKLPGPLNYILSEAFAFALILAEVVILTLYVSRRRANHIAMGRLKDMLVMCSSDKRFLVKQHSAIMRRQQRTC
ncbi:transmembrane channel-like protein 7 [Carassius auratus]|uniref:Transmembrane channel-like protein n=1 Tax=Carassius auratus TaxID=7957 RepID=A0A6P6KZR6_CARAU|nr:transmembrane channel-like protein 7 [Carassius auratus]